MDIESLAKAAAALAVPVLPILSFQSRKRRRRTDIRDNLKLADELRNAPGFGEGSLPVAWLHGRITVDVAQLVKQPLGTPKQPVPKAALVLAGVILVGSVASTYLLVKDGFSWWAIGSGLLAFMALTSIYGMFIDREISPEESGLPLGATPIRMDSVQDQIVTASIIGSTNQEERFSLSGPAGVSLRFIESMSGGRYEEGLECAEPTWLLCRIQSWVWNNRQAFESEGRTLDEAVVELVGDRDGELWAEFRDSEATMFREVWGSLDISRLGVASNQRVIGQGYERVIITELKGDSGFYVREPTLLQNALTFVVHELDGRWLISNHLGTAPPVPGLPPNWWSAEPG